VYEKAREKRAFLTTCNALTQLHATRGALRGAPPRDRSSRKLRDDESARSSHEGALMKLVSTALLLASILVTGCAVQTQDVDSREPAVGVEQEELSREGSDLWLIRCVLSGGHENLVNGMRMCCYTTSNGSTLCTNDPGSIIVHKAALSNLETKEAKIESAAP
jgi:hypothetical protein